MTTGLQTSHIAMYLALTPDQFLRTSDTPVFREFMNEEINKINTRETITATKELCALVYRTLLSHDDKRNEIIPLYSLVSLCAVIGNNNRAMVNALSSIFYSKKMGTNIATGNEIIHCTQQIQQYNTTLCTMGYDLSRTVLVAPVQVNSQPLKEKKVVIITKSGALVSKKHSHSKQAADSQPQTSSNSTGVENITISEESMNAVLNFAESIIHQCRVIESFISIVYDNEDSQPRTTQTSSSSSSLSLSSSSSSSSRAVVNREQRSDRNPVKDIDKTFLSELVLLYESIIPTAKQIANRISDKIASVVAGNQSIDPVIDLQHQQRWMIDTQRKVLQNLNVASKIILEVFMRIIRRLLYSPMPTKTATAMAPSSIDEQTQPFGYASIFPIKDSILTELDIAKINWGEELPLLPVYVERAISRVTQTVTVSGTQPTSPTSTSSFVVSSQHAGSLITDVCKVMEDEIKHFIQRVYVSDHDDEVDKVDYIFHALKSNHPGFLIEKSTQRPAPSCNNIAGSPATAALAVNSASSSSSEQSSSGAISELKAIFPDYGDAFLIACLRAFDGNNERTVDALLNENLPPNLVSMNRSLQSAWIGKGGEHGGVVVGKTGKSELKYELKRDESLIQKQKARIREEEKQQQLVSDLFEREYNDDYDDQVSTLLQQQHTDTMQGVTVLLCFYNCGYG